MAYLITDARREATEELVDRARVYRVAIKSYEQLFERLVDEGKITPFPLDWKAGAIGESFEFAARQEEELFAALREYDRLDEGKKDQQKMREWNAAAIQHRAHESEGNQD